MCEVVSKNIALKPIVFQKNALFSNMCTFYPIVLKRKIITAEGYPFFSLICYNNIFQSTYDIVNNTFCFDIFLN